MPERPRLVVATGNPGKLREYEQLLGGAGFSLVAHDPGVRESGATYEANAALKASAARDATGLPSLGDDSGLEVEALNGFPGLGSARLAPTQAERTAILLGRLRGRPRPWRARFVCVVALAALGRPVRTFRGQVEGELAPAPRGAGGFGYDPLFVLPEVGRTFAELPPADKHRWSHRARAVQRLRESGDLDRLLGSAAYP
ncbi:MAG TPA: RdgB/HAM1 family non-canonical purine NTP pyrophosphatase [Candidatus Acidoferrales bacterium]|nr:RdgB/HAM1 family non-canonical purine NTP pyrophosphatase [Candidatus Acidoferrales bacterium]